MTEVPSDVSMGELWRTMQSHSQMLANLTAVINNLPMELSAELDKRFIALDKMVIERLEHEGSKTELKLGALERRVAFLERSLWGVVAFIVVGFGAQIVQLIQKI